MFVAEFAVKFFQPILLRLHALAPSQPQITLAVGCSFVQLLTDSRIDEAYVSTYISIVWAVEVGDEFEPELLDLPRQVRIGIAAMSQLLKQSGPQLGRPRADTLKGSRHANMKELRFDAAGGVWRVAFAFDVERSAILLIAGDKSGGSQRRFYKEFIRKADDRFDAHVARLEARDKETGKTR